MAAVPVDDGRPVWNGTIEVHSGGKPPFCKRLVIEPQRHDRVAGRHRSCMLGEAVDEVVHCGCRLERTTRKQRRVGNRMDVCVSESRGNERTVELNDVVPWSCDVRSVSDCGDTTVLDRYRVAERSSPGDNGVGRDERSHCGAMRSGRWS